MNLSFGTVYKSNTLFQKILFSWPAVAVRSWYKFSRSSKHDKTSMKTVWERLPKLICQQNQSFSSSKILRPTYTTTRKIPCFSKRLEISIWTSFDTSVKVMSSFFVLFRYFHQLKYARKCRFLEKNTSTFSRVWGEGKIKKNSHWKKQFP